MTRVYITFLDCIWRNANYLVLFANTCFAILIGLIVSIVATLGLLCSKRQLPTAWTLLAAAAIVFNISAYSVLDYRGVIVGSLASILGPIGGYLLLVLALYQYSKDKRLAETGNNKE